MPAAARGAWGPLGWAGDTVSVHECGDIPNASAGSSNVFINGKPAHRVGDSNTSHASVPSPSCAPHSTNLSSGSPNVFVNGQPLARIGDPYDCGIKLTSGSSDVVVNDPQNPAISANNITITNDNQSILAWFNETSEAASKAITKVIYDNGLALDKDSIVEMLTTIIFGDLAKYEPRADKIVTEKDGNAAAIAAKYITVAAAVAEKNILTRSYIEGIISIDEYLSKIKELHFKDDASIRAAQTFRGGEGYRCAGAPCGLAKFMSLYKPQILEYEDLTKRYRFLREKLYNLTKAASNLSPKSASDILDDVYPLDDPKILKITADIGFDDQKELIKVERKIALLEKFLIENVAHNDLAQYLWKYSSFTLDKPVYIKREPRKYAHMYPEGTTTTQFVQGYLIRPENPGSTYSATVIDFKDVEVNEGIKVKYYLIPAGTRVIHTLEMADRKEILIRGEDLIRSNKMYVGSALQEMLIERESSKLKVEKLRNAMEEFKLRNPDKEIPKFAQEVLDKWDAFDKAALKATAIIAGGAAVTYVSWPAIVLIVAVTGLTSWFLNDEEYWAIWDSDNLGELESSLAKYYGITSQEAIGSSTGADRLNQLALWKSVQAVDVVTSAPFATLGWGMKAGWDNTERGWMYLMENIDELLIDGDKALTELLTPPDGMK
jgi:uncharacterized Zn-binding protein involved in type VI secretion